jgi:hypothetical protein
MSASPAIADNWTYASGRAAALTGALLSSDALQRLAVADSSAAVSAALSDSPLRTELSEAVTPAKAAEVVSAYYKKAMDSLRQDCPQGAMFELVTLPAHFAGLKDAIRPLLNSGEEVKTEEFSGLFADLEEESCAADGLKLLLNLLQKSSSVSGNMLLELALDSSRLLESLRLAAELKNPGVFSHVSDEVAVRSALMLWRIRIVAGENSDSPVLALVPRLVLRGELGSGLAGLLWRQPLTAWGDILSAEITRELGYDLFGSGEESRLNQWEKVAFDWLTRRARQLSSEAFGVGRVYGYAWGLSVEERNVRLAAVGRLRGVAPEDIGALFWETI